MKNNSYLYINKDNQYERKFNFIHHHQFYQRVPTHLQNTISSKEWKADCKPHELHLLHLFCCCGEIYQRE